jgi:hypothetical protein
MTLVRNGVEIKCIPNDNSLEEAEENECAKAMIKKLQKERPEELQELVNQERERQQLIQKVMKEEEGKSSSISNSKQQQQIPTLHNASIINKKPISPAELRKIARSAEYAASVKKYINNMEEATTENKGTTTTTTTPCAATVSKFYKLQETIAPSGKIV